MNDIKVTGFYITSYGDADVGIFDQTWKIEGDFYFDDKTQLEEMRQKIKEAFEVVYAENLGVETFEEVEQQIAKENELFKTDEFDYYGESTEI